VLGESNENHIVVEMGLDKGEKLYLSMPPDAETFKYSGLELMAEIERRKAEEEKKRQEMQENMNRPRQPRNFEGAPPGGAAGGAANRTRG